MTSEACPWCEPYTRVGLKPTRDETEIEKCFDDG